jgi:hypothetical protein
MTVLILHVTVTCCEPGCPAHETVGELPNPEGWLVLNSPVINNMAYCPRHHEGPRMKERIK